MLVACFGVVLLFGACGDKSKGGLSSNTDPRNKDCETAVNTNPITVDELEPIAKAEGVDAAALLAKVKEICTDPSISSPVDKAVAALKSEAGAAGTTTAEQTTAEETTAEETTPEETTVEETTTSTTTEPEGGECQDGIDNDGDGYTDWPDEEFNGCYYEDDPTEH